MVCLGNICRSPIADGLLRKKVSENNLDIFVDSAGTNGFHNGEKPDRRMRETAANFGTPIDELRSRQITVDDLAEFDVIYAMDSSNYNNIIKLASSEEQKAKVKMILNEVNPGANNAVPDPYYGGDQGFIDVYKMVDEATDIIIEKLKNNTSLI